MRHLMLIFFLGALVGHAQVIDSSTVRKINKYQFGGVYKSAISINAGGVTGFGGFTYDYFMSDHWRLEAGIGLVSVGFGFDYYPWSVKREFSRFKINIRNSIFYPFSSNIVFHSLGIGMTHFFKGKFNLGFDVGVSYAHPIDSWSSQDFILGDAAGAWPVYPHANIKFGYRFSFRAWKRARELDRERN